MIHESVHELRQDLRGIVGVADGVVDVLDDDEVRAHLIDQLARDAVFGTRPVLAFSRWLIWELGQILGARPASIHDLYMARARGEWTNRTVPAMNMRFTTYDATRSALRAAQKQNAAAIIFEIARSEMAFTNQEPAEYATMIIAAAIKEEYTWPLFIQGDHFQVQGARYRSDPEGALQEVKNLIDKAIPAGFWNIDIDTSTLVDLEAASLDEQQRQNYLRSAELTHYIRQMAPEGVTISLGGEIGEVGEQVSTVGELDAYVEGYKRTLTQLGDCTGLSKISVATGTHHGGVLLPDGSHAEVAVDFDALRDLGERARHHGMGGAVQHGASTLPEGMFEKFPDVQTLEIHLATGFTDAFFDHQRFPDDLRQAIYRHLDDYHADERMPSDTDIVFHLKSRKKAIGPFKADLWGFTEEEKEAIYRDLEDEYAFFYQKLNVVDTCDLVARVVTPVTYHKPMPSTRRGVGEDMGLVD